MLEIDYSLWPIGTLWIQVANFILLIFLMNIFLYRPIRRVLTQRDDETDSLQKLIADYQGWCEEDEKGIEEGVVEARKQGHMEKQIFKDKALEEEKEILQDAGFSVEKELGIARKKLEGKMADVKEALQAQVAGFSNELAEKILGRSIQ